MNKIVNINEDFSEDIFEEDQYELGQSEADSESSEYTESGVTEGSSDSEEEKCVVTRKGCVFFLVLTPRMKGRAFQAHPKM